MHFTDCILGLIFYTLFHIAVFILFSLLLNAAVEIAGSRVMTTRCWCVTPVIKDITHSALSRWWRRYRRMAGSARLAYVLSFTFSLAVYLADSCLCNHRLHGSAALL